MGCEDEVAKIGKKIDKMVSTSEQSQALDLLKALRDLPITLEVLQRTRIGMSVNALRKSSSDEDVISLSKSLIKQWKKLLSGSPGSKSSETSSSHKDKMDTTNGGSGDEGQSQVGRGNAASTQAAPSNSKAAPSNIGGNSLSRQTSFPAETTNSVRLKCREMLTNALKGEGAEKLEEAELQDLGAKIEDCIYQEFKDTNMKYKNKIRSRISNLKDTKNKNLRLNVLHGSILPERLAVMTSEEMATEEMKQLRQKFTKEAINDHQMTLTGGTKTDLLKCGKCKKSNCTYNQVQTRSADEPMTTFCYCNECGHRWKFC